jgi:hypothetical protein
MKSLIVSLLLLVTTTATFAQGKYSPARTPDEQLHETYGIRLFKGVEGAWFDLRDDNGASGAVSYANILDWLQGRVAGLQVYSYRNIKVPFLRNRPAAIFVDEIRVDYSFLNALSTADIGLVKVMPMAGVYAPGGAIAIYTKRGEAEEEEETR